MLRRSFRLGLGVALAIALAAALFKVARGRQEARLLADPPPGRWPTEERPPPPAWVPPEGDACPATHPIKAKLSSGLFHLPGMFAYARTRPDRCYATEQGAEADGLTRAKR